MHNVEEIKHKLAVRLKDARKRLGESQDTFAKRFGVSTNTVSRWESEKYQLSLEAVWWLLHEGSTEVDRLRDLVATQGANGTWNYDPYMQGMYNGMELMLALLEDREPNYKKAPEVWLCDRKVSYRKTGPAAIS